jgi:hypothetical protein
VLRWSAGVFPAIKGAKGINFADGFAYGIITQPGTDIGKFATGAAAEALAPPAFIDRQKGGKGSPYLGTPGIFGGLFRFSYSHN